MFVFNQFGDLERCALRPGNVYSTDEWERVLNLTSDAAANSSSEHHWAT
jgi:hypothetical protein